MNKYNPKLNSRKRKRVFKHFSIIGLNYYMPEKTYKVYTGKVSASDMSDILKESQLDIKLNSDTDTEVWLTQDNYVYKVYYKLDNLTIYASYFGYDTINKIDLNMYKID